MGNNFGNHSNRSHGMVITEIDSKDLASFQAALKPVTESWMRKIGEKFVATARRDMVN